MAIERRLETVSYIGSMIKAGAYVVFLYIWWQAFRRVPADRPLGGVIEKPSPQKN
jgi:hypothetical protein